MTPWHRRTVLAIGIAVATGTVLGTVGARTEREDEDRQARDGPTDRAGDDDIELSVSVPESVPYREIADPIEDAADVVITVCNTGTDATSITATLEIGDVDEPVVLEPDAGDHDTVRFGVLPRELGVGAHDWTVTADGKIESGSLTVVDDER
ncbi:hypothetical protein [Natrinema salaciae]|uniref:CARDB protein n=1 Tax=Natrinema salaciae TaxID=1186196 RepID=A0A1H9GWB4_9EURY|nr:hypothetical protein [Natrinema salaciae]SEQ54412.1 hypothetical protein SAMN04489841_2017 [Natrinema salaciae]